MDRAKAFSMKFSMLPAKFAFALLLFLILPLPYPFYTLIKIPVCIVAVYYCVKLYQKNHSQPQPFWALLGIAILFNPLLPIHLFFRTLWIVVDIASAIYMYMFFTGKIKIKP